MDSRTTQDQSSAQEQPEHSQHATLHLLDIAFDAGKLFEEFLVQAPETAQGSLRHLSLHLQIHPDLRSKFAEILDRLGNRARTPEKSASRSNLLLEPAGVKAWRAYSDKAVLSEEQQLQNEMRVSEQRNQAEYLQKNRVQKGTHEHEED